MANGREIVITGLGLVSPIGIGAESYWTSLQERQSGIGSLDFFDDPDLSQPIGGRVDDFEPKKMVRPRKSLKVMSRDIQLGFAAADQAIASAALDREKFDPERMGIIFGGRHDRGRLGRTSSRLCEMSSKRAVRLYPLGCRGDVGNVSALDA